MRFPMTLITCWFAAALGVSGNLSAATVFAPEDPLNVATPDVATPSIATPSIATPGAPVSRDSVSRDSVSRALRRLPRIDSRAVVDRQQPDKSRREWHGRPQPGPAQLPPFFTAALQSVAPFGPPTASDRRDRSSRSLGSPDLPFSAGEPEPLPAQPLPAQPLPAQRSGGSQRRLEQLPSPLSAASAAAESSPGGQTGEVVWAESQVPGRVSLYAQAAELKALLRMIAARHQLNLVIGPGVEGEVTLSIEDADFQELLSAILSVNGHTWHTRDNLLYVTSLNSERRAGSQLQGRTVRVFSLNYIAAADTERMVQGMLSPVGQVFISEADSADKTRTRELLVVEDIPQSLARLELFIAELDQAPRQVLIEAHVLQVVLNDLNRHGVNLRPMARLNGGSVTFESLGFADEEATSGMKISLQGTDIRGLVELIQTNSNARTLASPKVLVANRQESNIQIGRRLSFLTTTVTQTAAVQSVQFLDTGVVLNVIPLITDDQQILMEIRPKVSGGQLNPETELPEEESTELSTTVLLPDGGGVIIGGLIKEDDVDSTSSVPGFSRIPLIGRLFRRHEVIHTRSEVIVALTARIQPYPETMRPHEHQELQIAVPPYAASELTRPLFNPNSPVIQSPEPQPFPG